MRPPRTLFTGVAGGSQGVEAMGTGPGPAMPVIPVGAGYQADLQPRGSGKGSARVPGRQRREVVRKTRLTWMRPAWAPKWLASIGCSLFFGLGAFPVPVPS